MKQKVALITGATGQDGSYLIEFLIKKGYIVHGTKRRASLFNTNRIEHIYKDPHIKNRNLVLHYGDMTDSLNLTRILQEVQPDEIYNLAAQSHVKVSFETPEYTANADALGTLRLLEAIRLLGLTEKTRFYQASTSELYGNTEEIPQKESTPFYPRSPYGAAKLYAYWITVNYREAYKIFASNGILFNHESPRRGGTFVTRKITRAVSRIAHGMQKQCYLGNLNAKRDWGHARDYVRAMWLIMQHDRADDWVVATGRTTSIRDFLAIAFRYCGIELEFTGKNEDEIARIAGIDRARAQSLQLNTELLSLGTTVVSIDPSYYRPTEVHVLQGDAARARKELGWEAECALEELVADMMSHDLAELSSETLRSQQHSCDNSD